MSKWFLITLILSFISAIVAILVRFEKKKEMERLEKGELTADDFDLILEE